MIDVKRRQFVALLGGLAAWPQIALAQVARRPVIGWLTFASKDAALFTRYVGQFLRGMQELGYKEGHDFDLVVRYANFETARLPQLAAELVQLRPDVIVTAASLTAVPLKQATDTIPIVVAALADPAVLGLSENNARPSGNVTGIMPYVKGLPAKQLELARELVPHATQIGILDDVTDPKARPQRREIEAAAQGSANRIVSAEVKTAGDIGPAFAALAAAGVNVVIVEQSSMLLLARQPIAEAAGAKKMPTVYGYREHVDAGGLISYGVNVDWLFHRTAYYVDRILKGTKVAELPVEFPTKIELLVNLKTAKTLGLEIAPTLLVRADEVIE